MRHKPSAPGRSIRVADQIQRELAEMIRLEVKDPRIGMVTLTGVDITADYAYATVYFSCLPDDEASIERSTEGLQRASGFMRSQIGRRLRIHTTPEIRFKHDISVARGSEMSRLIDAALAKHAVDNPPAEQSSEHFDSVPPDDLRS
jgi:ribosome-binding factor A